MKTAWNQFLMMLTVAVQLVCTQAGCERKATDAAPVAASSPPSTVVKAAYVPSGYYLPFLIVEQDGLLSKRGYTFQLVPHNDNTQMITMFLNGHIDVTAQSSLTMFPIEAKTPGMFKFIYGQYNNSCFFVVPTGSPITTLTDLKGKRIGTWKSPTCRTLINLILKRHKLSTADGVDFTIVPYGANEVAPLLEAGKLDVAFIYDSVAAKLVASGKYRYLNEQAINSLLPGSAPLFNGGAFIRTRVITDEPEKAKAIREAFSEALETIRKDPDRVNRLIAERLQLELGTAQAMNRDLFDWPQASMVESARKTMQLIQEDEVSQKSIDIDSLFWMRP